MRTGIPCLGTTLGLTAGCPLELERCGGGSRWRLLTCLQGPCLTLRVEIWRYPESSCTACTTFLAYPTTNSRLPVPDTCPPSHSSSQLFHSTLRPPKISPPPASIWKRAQANLNQGKGIDTSPPRTVSTSSTVHVHPRGRRSGPQKHLLSAAAAPYGVLSQSRARHAFRGARRWLFPFTWQWALDGREEDAKRIGR